ncbi:Retron-type RNA-directed DNA polymerase [Enhygromyxa salina]|uniref:RNA-directed DNA polymerase n=1 Tax=Enhygromyxa salina TaxID=215803 RepID=A0A0C2CW65_9BACT|nr:reverse transcriptase domain-containing protein [Enhygromyxa salina]KIG12107.1 Retron-type RNA-directed DNA polymerase [Enhygromyxa salina]
MLLANLIFELRPLLDDPDANLRQIVARLRAHDDFAEYEVARHYVASKVEGVVRSWLASPDPRVRTEAIVAVRQIFSRPAAAKLLRHLVKDATLSVRRAARRAVGELGLDDVALRDTSLALPRYPRARGGWNPTGWQFGTGASRGRPRLEPAGTRAGLPTLPDLAALTGWLGLDAAGLRRLMRPGTHEGAPYVNFEIPKARGGRRTISAPRAPLRAVQRQILAQILSKVPTHDAAHGFVPGRSTVTNAAPHVGALLLLKTDIREFFPTIHYWRVRGLFFTLGYGEAVSGALAGLCTQRAVINPDATAPQRRVVWPGLMPQGAPTSPAISNLVCRRLDARLLGLATKLGARYTRYADDLSFSFHDSARVEALDVGRAYWWIDQILQQEGFAEHPGKRQILRPHRRQQVTGLVVNDHLTVPRDARRRFRAILHNCRQRGVAAEANGRDDFPDYLRGFAAYVDMVQPDLGARWVAEVDALLADQAL